MDRKKALKNKESNKIFESLNELHRDLSSAFSQQFNRSLPFSEEIFDRWERAKKLGFGEGSSIYDSSYVFGEVKVGKNTWVGPFTIIDGSGKLEIGDHCTISAGVHIYTHDNVAQTLTAGKSPIERETVVIGDYTYIGPNAIIKKGITIGNYCVIGANSFINKSIPDNSVAVGSPIKIIGSVKLDGDNFSIEYFRS
jgi:acetyltransferase-like isoleucine patch superfamily enzyme